MDVARRKSIYEFMINAPYWRQKAWNESNGKSGWKLAGINPFNLFQFIERWAGSNILDSTDKEFIASKFDELCSLYEMKGTLFAGDVESVIGEIYFKQWYEKLPLEAQSILNEKRKEAKSKPVSVRPLNQWGTTTLTNSKFLQNKKKNVYDRLVKEQQEKEKRKKQAEDLEQRQRAQAAREAKEAAERPLRLAELEQANLQKNQQNLQLQQQNLQLQQQNLQLQQQNLQLKDKNATTLAKSREDKLSRSQIEEGNKKKRLEIQRLKTQQISAEAQIAQARRDTAIAEKEKAVAEKEKAVAEAVGKRKIQEIGDTSPGPSSGTRKKYINCVFNNYSNQ